MKKEGKYINRSNTDYLIDLVITYSKKACLYFWNNILKKEEVFTVLFLLMFVILLFGIFTYDSTINYFSLETMKIATFISLGLAIYAHIIDKKKVDKVERRKDYERYYTKL